jgi:hypothetical protein
MMQMKFLCLILFIGILSSCSRVEKFQRANEFFTALNLDQESLLKKLNSKKTVTGVQTSLIDTQYEVVTTASDEKYFLKDHRVVSSSRRPKSLEQRLMYWRVYFQGHLYREEVIPGHDRRAHSLPFRQLACDSLGMGVLYDPNIEQVMRVFYYGKK